jgi:hypothetical protein
MKKYISYKKFIYVVVFLSIIIISGLFLLYTSLIHSNSIKESIKEDSNVMTELIFQNLYTVMKSGGDKELLDNTIKNLEKKVSHIKVNIVQKADDTSSEIIKNSFLTKKSEISQKDLDIQFITPIFI